MFVEGGASAMAQWHNGQSKPGLSTSGLELSALRTSSLRHTHFVPHFNPFMHVQRKTSASMCFLDVSFTFCRVVELQSRCRCNRCITYADVVETGFAGNVVQQQ